MIRLDQLGAQTAAADDAADALVALASAAGSSSIASHTRRVSEQLAAARLFVSIVVDPDALATVVDCLGHARDPRPVETWPLWIQSARGIRFGIAPPTTRWPAGRVDVVLVDEPHARRLARADMPRHAQTYVVDARQRDHLARMLELVDRIATEVGADRIAAQLTTQLRAVCRQLWSHLADLQRALGLARVDPQARIHTLSIARVLAEAVFERRAELADPDRDALIAWLTKERTKFLMSTKADAVLEIDRRVAHTTERRTDQRRAATAVTRDLAIELLAVFWARLRAEAEPRIAEVSRQYVTDLERSIGGLAEAVPLTALAHGEHIRGFRRDLDIPTSPNMLATLFDFVGGAARRRHEVRDGIVAMLDAGSLRLTTRVLEAYDLRSLILEERLCDLIDTSIESTRVAALFATEAHAGGPDAVAQARSRIAAWSTRLAEIHELLH